jgi:hypothetical protein
MNCAAMQSWLYRKIDGELSDSENGELDAHLAQCVSCNREYRLLSLPNRIAQLSPPPAPSSAFNRMLKTLIDGETQKNAVWQAFWGLAKPMVPALAGITLALLSIFAYQQIRNSEVDLYRTYDRAFLSEDQSNQMLVADQGDINSYENLLNASTEQEFRYHRNQNPK